MSVLVAFLHHHETHEETVWSSCRQEAVHHRNPLNPPDKKSLCSDSWGVVIAGVPVPDDSSVDATDPAHPNRAWYCVMGTLRDCSFPFPTPSHIVIRIGSGEDEEIDGPSVRGGSEEVEGLSGREGSEEVEWTSGRGRSCKIEGPSRAGEFKESERTSGRWNSKEGFVAGFLDDVKGRLRCSYGTVGFRLSCSISRFSFMFSSFKDIANWAAMLASLFLRCSNSFLVSFFSSIDLDGLGVARVRFFTVFGSADVDSTPVCLALVPPAALLLFDRVS